MADAATYAALLSRVTRGLKHADLLARLVGNGGGKSLHIQLQMNSIATPFLGTNLPPSILDTVAVARLVVTVVRDSQ